MRRTVSAARASGCPSGLHVVPVVSSRALSQSDAGRPPSTEPKVSAVATACRVLGALYAWALWAFMLALVGSQFLGIVWNSSVRTSEEASPFPFATGLRRVSEADESPYVDRAFACMLHKRRYSPRQLHLAMEASGVAASSVDADQGGVNGLRVVQRDGSPLALTDEARASYAATCGAMASMVDPILDSCAALGYNVTRDALRAVAGADSRRLVLLPDSLPVAILPLADNSRYARIAVPGWDGRACVFQLEGADSGGASASAVASGAGYRMVAAGRVDREAVVAQRVRSFTGAASGTWRNGWYEVELADGSSSKWFGDAVSSGRAAAAAGEIHAPQRQFRLQASGAQELDCAVAGECAALSTRAAWGVPDVTASESASDFAKAVVVNASRVGGFFARARRTTRISSRYDLEMFISDVSVLAGLLRWGTALAALHFPHARRRQVPVRSAGIGVLSGSRSFALVPILLLPRLRVMLAAFATLGLGGHAARNAGDQLVLVDAWFVVYPAAAELLVFLYCLLNWLGVLLKRRMTDALFGPTLAALCLVHFFRDALVHVWFPADTTRSLPVQASEFADADFLSLLTSDMLARLSGGGSARSGALLLAFKLGLLGANALLLLVPSRFTSFQARTRERDAPCASEQALAFRASAYGGLGISELYEGGCDGDGDSGSDALPVRLCSYEIVRLGYIVVGGKFLVSISDWFKLLLLSPMRFARRPTNIRVVVFMVDTSDKGCRGGMGENDVGRVRSGPIIVRVNDQRLRSVKLTDVSISSFQ